MILITKKVEEILTRNMEARDVPTDDKMIAAKLFFPDGGWTAFLIEWSMPIERPELIFAYTTLDGGFYEFGDISLDECRKPMGRFQLTTERDRWFEPITVRELKAKIARGEHP